MSTDSLKVKIEMYPEGQVSLRTLGELPYMVLEFDTRDDGGLQMALTTGGGVPQEEKSLDYVLSLLRMALEHDKDEASPAQQ